MKTTNKNVAKLFCKGIASQGSNFYSPDGIRLISYNTTVAFDYGYFVLKTSNGWTLTTKKQLSSVRHNVVIRCNLFRYGKHIEKPTIDEIIVSLESEKRTLNLKRKADRTRLEQIECDMTFLKGVRK